ncbi:MAG: uridine kinase [Acidimicrobiia bacterium]|nr:uridine kinase [Acidimicrobiia bacterium]
MARTIQIRRLSNAIQAVDASATRLVLIDGLGGAGKSVLAEALAGELGVPVIEGDDFYLPSVERQRAGIGSDAIGASYDWRRLERQVLAPLSRGKGARYQRFDWDSDRLGEWASVPGQDTVVVEGVYLLRDQLRHYASVSIWVETPREVRLARGIERDGETARSRWINEWMPAEDAYLSAMRPDVAATLVVDGRGRRDIDPRRSAVVAEARSPLDGLL